MKSLLAATLAWAIASTCANASEKAAGIAVRAALQPGEMHEECQRLEAGEKRKYHWSAGAPVDFNIHYHRGDEVFYPVKREAMRRDGGTFTARTVEDYCWTWSARDKAARIEGRIENR